MSSKIRCILLDDEEHSLDLLKRYVEQIDFVEVVKSYLDPAQLVDTYKTLDFELCILDINMPKYSGLDVAQILNDKAVIFITGQEDQLPGALNLDPIAVIVKPLHMDRLTEALGKARKILDIHEVDGLHRFKTDKGETPIEVQDIWFITTHVDEPRDKNVYLENGTILRCKDITFPELQKILPPSTHCVANRSAMVSKRAIENIKYDLLILKLKDENGRNMETSLPQAFKKNLDALFNR